MKFFECCHKCVPPKRYPGCSAKCPEYKKGRAALDEMRERERKYKELEQLNKKYPNY